MLAAFTCQNEHLGHSSSEEGLIEAVKPAPARQKHSVLERSILHVYCVCVCECVWCGGGGGGGGGWGEGMQ